MPFLNLMTLGADAICHGCTGKGNDQVRFELAIQAFAPEMDIIAPWRFWELNSREKEIEYVQVHNIPLKITAETNYSKNKNLWHLSHEGLDLEDWFLFICTLLKYVICTEIGNELRKMN